MAEFRKVRVEMRKIYETAVILIGTLGWWGFVYPELCLTEDAYEQEAEAEKSEAEDAKAGMETDREQEAGQAERFWEEGFKIGDLRIKSRAAEYVYQVKEKDMTEKD